MMNDNTGAQALWPQMIAALAAIDDALGLPQDGCNSTAQTLAAIEELKAAAQRGGAQARTEIEAHDPVADALDDMSALGLHWTRNRERGRMPQGIRRAMLLVAREALAHAGMAERVDEPAVEPTNISGPRGTHGCSCMSRNATECAAARNEDKRCGCLCHQWNDKDCDGDPT